MLLNNPGGTTLILRGISSMKSWEKGFYLNQKDIIYIKTIVDEGGVSQAAKKLFVSQPSLSQSVKRIEEALGTPIFKRAPKGLVLTPEGEEYYKMARKVLKIYDSFEDELRSMAELKIGTVTIGATHHRGVIVLPKFLAEFHMKYPGIRVNVIENGTNELEDLLLCGKIDFGILRVPRQNVVSDQIVYHGLTREKFVILVPKGHPVKNYAKHQEGYCHPVLDPKRLAEENFLLPEPSMRLYENIMSILKKAGITSPKSTFSSIYGDTWAYLTAAGEGVTIVSDSILVHHPELSVDVYDIPDEYGAFWDSSLAVLKDGYLSKAAKTVIKEYEDFLSVQR